MAIEAMHPECGALDVGPQQRAALLPPQDALTQRAAAIHEQRRRKIFSQELPRHTVSSAQPVDATGKRGGHFVGMLETVDDGKGRASLVMLDDRSCVPGVGGKAMPDRF